MAVCWVILREQQMFTVTQAVHSLLYLVAKCSLFSVVTWKYIIKYLQKCEGVLTSVKYCKSLYHICDQINAALVSRRDFNKHWKIITFSNFWPVMHCDVKACMWTSYEPAVFCTLFWMTHLQTQLLLADASHEPGKWVMIIPWSFFLNAHTLFWQFLQAHSCL